MPITSQDAEAFLKAASLLGFSAEIQTREPNRHPQGMLNEFQEQQFRSVLSDFPEYIIPVFWSESTFVGQPSPDVGTDAIELLAAGYTVITEAGTRAGGQLPPSASTSNSNTLTGILSKRFSNFIGQSNTQKPSPYVYNYLGVAYVDGTIRGTALQDGIVPGPRRQGWLAICRSSIVLVGFWTDVTPIDAWFQSFPNDNSIYTFEERNKYITLARFLPNDVERCQLYVVAALPFTQIEHIEAIELIRFDGLAALLYSLHDLYWTAPNDVTVSLHKDEEIRCFPNLVKQLREEGHMGLINTALEDAFERIEYGACVAGGTGRNGDGSAIKALWNSALGLAIQSQVDGRYFFVESNFSDLDNALSLIESEISGTSTSDSQRAAVSESVHGLTDDIERLASLFQAGVLTAEEFAAAKSAVIQKWSS